MKIEIKPFNELVRFRLPIVFSALKNGWEFPPRRLAVPGGRQPRKYSTLVKAN